VVSPWRTGSPRVQRGGFESAQAAAEALARALKRLRREQDLIEAPRLEVPLVMEHLWPLGSALAVRKSGTLVERAGGDIVHARVEVDAGGATLSCMVHGGLDARSRRIR
jgi:hypothetical protein